MLNVHTITKSSVLLSNLHVYNMVILDNGILTRQGSPTYYVVQNTHSSNNT